LRVCSSGCAFTDFQAALDAALPGDTILLRAGETFVGHFVLPEKAAASGPPIVIRSDAPDSALPPADTRLVPFGYTGGNTALGSLARLRGRGGIWKTTPVIKAAPRAHHFLLQFLDVDGIVNDGWYTLLELGTNNQDQPTYDSVPYSIVLDRVFVHGHPTKGQQRCISMNGRDLEVRNSYVTNCSSFALDSQAIAAFNAPGPLRIINNYLEATGENLMLGGADPRISGLIQSDVEIRRNHFFKPVAWQRPIFERPSAPSAGVTSSGSVQAGAHYFTVVAVLEAGGDIALSDQSPETSVSVGQGNAAVVLNWSAVSGADRYRIYHGDWSGGQNRYTETTGSETQLVYRADAEVWSSPPTFSQSWNVKNLLELKNAQRVLIDGNVFEFLWPASQNGYAVLFTPRNDDGGAPWSVVRDVVFSNNILRHVSGGINILGQDYLRGSQRTERITIRNNLFYDVSFAWGGAAHAILLTGSPVDVKIDHNSIFHDGMVVLIDDGASTGFEFTNNVAPHNQHGLFGSGAGTGTSALNAYFPGSVFRRNALGGGPASQYPPDNLFPAMATFTAQFVDIGSQDFRLVSGSIFRGAGTDGRDLGVDFSLLNSAQASASQGGSSFPPNPGPGEGGGGGGGGSGGEPTPYGSTAVALPGVIQAENFDEGGASVAYSDTSPGNSGGQYRSTDVDIEPTSDPGGSFNVGWTAAGEWLVYSVNVGTSGVYDIEVRVASLGQGGTFHLEANGADLTGPLTVPNTGSWQTWTSVRRSGVTLSSGSQRWRLVMDTNAASGFVGNFNEIRVAAAGSSGGTGGTAIALPGVIQAEDFDQGGASVAYADSTPGNSGGVYRTGDVDVEATTDSGGGYNVGWAQAGEWLAYTVNVAAAGTYNVDVRVASTAQGGVFHVEANGADITGPLTIPSTGGWQTWTTIRRSGVTLGAGSQRWRLVMDSNGATGWVGNFNDIRVTAITSGGAAGGGSSSPHNGSAVTLPGTLQAEDFDNGGEGTAYHDLSGSNEGGAYRDTGVDLEATADAGGGFNVGWLLAGEWLKYTVNVTAGGSFDVEFRVASPGAGGTFHLEINGSDVTGPITIPDTGGWQNWTTVRKTGLNVAAGQQVWRLLMDGNGASTAVGNINFVRLVSAAPTASGGDIVLYSTDVSTMTGNWTRVNSSSGAAGFRMQSTDFGAPAVDSPLAAPGDYFEAQFVPQANRPYRLWLRLRASGDSKFNDSVWVQLSGAVDSGGSPLWRTGTGSGLLVNLEACSNCGVASWGWTNGAWWLGDAAIVRFPSSSTETIRIQTREDGLDIDQIVLSPSTYFDAAPGSATRDTTVVAK
jgi:hypothetical protein